MNTHWITYMIGILVGMGTCAAGYYALKKSRSLTGYITRILTTALIGGTIGVAITHIFQD